LIGSKTDNGTGKHGEIRRCKKKKLSNVKEVKIIRKESMNDDELD
jgi:hypothetical protein